jgi:putative ABC transport system substrate-binding protein
MAKVGILVLGNSDPDEFLSTLRDGLRDHGYVEGQNIQFEFRSANGSMGLLVDLAKELTRLKVEVIVAWQTPAVEAAMKATHEIPIVMASAGDPIGTGLVASLARPGSNVTGNSGTTAELAGKNIELIREVIPSAHRVAVLGLSTDPFTKSFIAQIDSAARNMGITIITMEVSGETEFETAVSAVAKSRVDVAIIQPSLLRKRLVELTLQYRLPTFSPNRLLPAMGGLISYGTNFVDLYRKTAVYVDKVLKGANPTDLPVQEPTKFELVINLRTAKALGLRIPPTLLDRADEVIE